MPKILLALQFVLRHLFRVKNVIAVRLGKAVHSVSKYAEAKGSYLIYFFDDQKPHYYCYESKDTALDIRSITDSTNARIIQCIIGKPHQKQIISSGEIAESLMPLPTCFNSDVPRGPQPHADREPRGDGSPGPARAQERAGLETIPEGDDEDADIMQIFHDELMNEEVLPIFNISEEEKQLLLDPMPVTMVEEDTVLFTVVDPESCGDAHQDALMTVSLEFCGNAHQVLNHDEDDADGAFVELCFTAEMAPIILDEEQHLAMESNQIATLRIYVSQNIKRAVVVKEDNILNKKELEQNAAAVAEATVDELTTWLNNKCFEKCLRKNAQNLMTSRYVAKWKSVYQKDGTWKWVIRMRLVLRGFMDLEAQSLDTFAGTARRQSQRLLASEAACQPEWIIASLDIDKAFLKGFTYKELADATGEKERIVCFTLPPGSARLLRRFKGFEDFDEAIHVLRCPKPGTGTKDAPRAFSLKLRRTTKGMGMTPLSFDQEFEMKQNLLTAKHVDDVNMAGTENQIDIYKTKVDNVFGSTKIHKHEYTNCGVRSIMDKEHNVSLDQDEYIKTLRPIVSPELTGASPEQEATKNLTDMFVSLRGAIAYVLLTQAWLQVYVVALQRVQVPTILDIRRLNAITRKLQRDPQKLIFHAMRCIGQLDIHTDSGYRRIESAEDVKGYGMRGMCSLRRGVPVTRGNALLEKQVSRGNANLVHLLDSVSKTHRLVIRSSYSAEIIGAAHGIEDAYPTIISLIELKKGSLSDEELKKIGEQGQQVIQATLTIDAEGVFKSITSSELKTPAEKTLLGHVMWIREYLRKGILHYVRWCDTRDMTADGHTKGSVDRKALIDLMHGKQIYEHDFKTYAPHRADRSSVFWTTTYSFTPPSSRCDIHIERCFTESEILVSPPPSSERVDP